MNMNNEYATILLVYNVINSVSVMQKALLGISAYQKKTEAIQRF